MTGRADRPVFRTWRGPLTAAIAGMHRVNRAPAILIGVWALTLLVSLPLALALRGMLAQHLGASLAADTAASGVNYDWMQEFSEQASGLGTTFTPTVRSTGSSLFVPAMNTVGASDSDSSQYSASPSAGCTTP